MLFLILVKHPIHAFSSSYETNEYIFFSKKRLIKECFRHLNKSEGLYPEIFRKQRRRLAVQSVCVGHSCKAWFYCMVEAEDVGRVCNGGIFCKGSEVAQSDIHTHTHRLSPKPLAAIVPRKDLPHLRQNRETLLIRQGYDTHRGLCLNSGAWLMSACPYLFPV